MTYIYIYIKTRFATPDLSKFKASIFNLRSVSSHKLKGYVNSQVGNRSFSSRKLKGYVSNTWIVDLGATHHICHNHKLFINIKKIDGIKVTLPNKNCVPFNMVGDAYIEGCFTLQNDFKFNLISISALTSNSPVWVFFFMILL